MGEGIRSKLARAIVRRLSAELTGGVTHRSDFARLRHEVRPCDVILVEGRSRVSEVIKLVTQSSWSHAALYIGRLHEIENPLIRHRIRNHYDTQPDVQLIIESELGRGTVVRPLTLYDKQHLRICRPKDISYPDAQRVISYCVQHLGRGYDVRQIFDLARLLYPWRFLPRRWRSSLFRTANATTRTVCSTLIAEAFGAIHYPILPLVKSNTDEGTRVFRRNPRLCVPRDFDYSPYFDIIKYPFLDDTNQRGRYQMLPWGHEEHLAPHELGEWLPSARTQDNEKA